MRKWLRRNWDQQRRRRGRRLGAFAEFLKGRAPEVGFNAVVLSRELIGRGYAGSYSAVVKGEMGSVVVRREDRHDVGV